MLIVHHCVLRSLLDIGDTAANTSAMFQSSWNMRLLPECSRIFFLHYFFFTLICRILVSRIFNQLYNCTLNRNNWKNLTSQVMFRFAASDPIIYTDIFIYRWCYIQMMLSYILSGLALAFPITFSVFPSFSQLLSIMMFRVIG